MSWASKAMMMKMCATIWTIQTTLNKVIRIPVKPAVIIKLGWVGFGGIFHDKEISLVRQPECLVNCI